MGTTILVYSEDSKTTKELLGKARQLVDSNGGQVASLAVDNDLVELAKGFADTIYTPQGSSAEYSPEVYTDLLAAAVEAAKPDLVLVGATKRGLEVAPRFAERLDMASVAWATGFEPNADGSLCVQAMIFTGMGLSTYRFENGPVLATVAPGTFGVVEANGRAAQVVALDAQVRSPRLQVQSYKEKTTSQSGVEDAAFVIDVGMGVKEKSDLALFDGLAEILNAELGCSRPVSSDRDWFPEWLGLSGAKLHANLCISVGISGSIQHVIGIRNSKVVMAVNNDENAGIFSQADYGVLADLYAFIPALTERMRARSIQPV